jgi:cyclic-di-AMP phosphodiesterase PgpH
MRPLKFWAEQIWQRDSRSVQPTRSQTDRAGSHPSQGKLPQRGESAIIPTPKAQGGQQARIKDLRLSRQRIVLIMAVVVVSLTSALGHRFYNIPMLDVGKIAPATIAAPVDISLEDRIATEAQRKQARTVAQIVLKIDNWVNDDIQQEIQSRLDRGNELRQLAGEFPFTTTPPLTLLNQEQLRKAAETDWQTVLTLLSTVPSPNPGKEKKTVKLPLPKLNAWQQAGLKDLMEARKTFTPDQFAALLNQIMTARQHYNSALKTLNDSTIAKSNYPYDATLLALPDPVWQTTQAKIQQVTKRILAQGISIGLPASILEQAVNLQVQADIPPAAQPIAVKLLLNVLRPNLIKDEEQSKLQAEKAAQAVQPVMVTLQKGEVIVRPGEKITATQFLVLDSLNLSRRGTNWRGLIAFGLLVSGAVCLFWSIERRFQPELRFRDYGLLWLLTLTTPLLIVLGVPSTNLPAIGMLTSSFYGSGLAALLIGLAGGLLPLGTALPLATWLPSAAGGMVAALFSGRLRTREELALLGVGIGITQGVLYLLLGIVSGVGWYTLLGLTAIHGLLGLAWSIVAIGVSPYLEHVFDLVTTVRLVELANPNRPLLKRLAADTPGTFQHTLFVATLAEAAARELGCNVELVRTGTLYHDIGKMHDPMGFIENQMGEVNKHDLIADPWKSAAIIKKHVTEGIVMARKARLPKAVEAFIPEHQGSMLIAYFYHQAQEAAAQDPTRTVVDADFRYDGPAPQSRETGIVMVADSCEAALRSLKDATPEQALNMINKILKARWEDGQLAASGLRREEMPKIARIFVQVWQQSNHQRIAYPKLGAS